MEEFYKGEKIHDYICGDSCPFWELVSIDSDKGYCVACGEKKYRGSECTCPETAVTREPADNQFDGYNDPHDISDDDEEKSEG